MSGSNDNSTASTSSSSSSTSSSSSSSASSSASSSGYKPTSSRSTLPLFTPASESFNPRPYHPHASSSVNRNRSSSQASSSRQTLTASGSQPKAPKSIYEDTGNVIIRAPFDVFPGCESCPEGLTYRHFQENPNWYLHIDDFRKEGEGENSTRVVYPSYLEPGRGWCPASKKEVKEKGPEVLGDNVVKLRCTLCDKEYGGVNAKSMWRRHVLEKHKIPMSNRRDEALGRSRSLSTSNKENSGVNKTSPLAEPIQLPTKPKKATAGLRSALSNVKTERPKATSISPELLSVPLDSTTTSGPIAEESRQDEQEDDSALRQHSGPTLVQDDLLGMGKTIYSVLGRDTQSSSTLTPVRVGSKRAAHPWKYTSPSHPLYSDPEEVFLGIPIKGITGEGLRSKYVALQASPFPGMPNPSSQLSSPVAPSPLSSKIVTGRVIGWKVPIAKDKGKQPALSQPSPLRSLYRIPFSPLNSDNSLIGSRLFSSSFDTEGESSFTSFATESTSGESILNWFDLSSPVSAKGKGKGKEKASKSSLPDTPIRRSKGKSSILEDLQLVDGAEDASALPPSLGRFEFDLPGSTPKGSKLKDDFSLGFGGFMESPSKVLFKMLDTSYNFETGISSCQIQPLGLPASLDELHGDSDGSASDEQFDPFIDDLPPAKKRRTSY